MSTIAVGNPCAYRVVRRAVRSSASNPEPGWISQCQHPRCPGYWRTGLATEALAIRSYAEHQCDERHMVLHVRCFQADYLEGKSNGRIDVDGAGSPGTPKEPEMTEQATTPEPQPATEAKPAKSKKAGKLTPCFCRTFEVGVDTGTDENPDITIETTGCDRMTNRTFAQGHDAKLVSFLVAAELDGKDIRYGRDSGMVTTTDAVGAAKLVSQELAHKAKVALANGQNRHAKRAERAAAKQVKGAERAAALQAKLDAKAKAAMGPEQAAVKDASGDEATVTNIPEAKVAGKVGRWEYKGMVGDDGSFTFMNGGGQEQTVPADKWVRLEG